MPFVKLDTGILDSSLWIDREARECFVTALLMAVPRQFSEPISQLEVRTLERTGFVAPPGWYGFVAAAGPGIVRRAMITDQEAGLSALERLGSPEAESRNPEHDGRRMIRIDGGYLVLNFMLYRERDEGAAARMRLYRARKAGCVTANGDDVTCNSAELQRTVTEAEAEADKKIYVAKPRSELHKNIIAAYHEILPDLPAVKTWPERRKRKLDARIDERLSEGKQANLVAYWAGYFRKVAASDFLCGRSKADWRCPGLEWLLEAKNFEKVIEGGHDNARPA